MKIAHRCAISYTQAFFLAYLLEKRFGGET